MLPELKVYKIDYEFIINNYLDVNLWDKKWNLLVYKEHQFELSLDCIRTATRRIDFKIKKNGFYMTETITYDINNTSIDILKQQINGAIFRVMENYEHNLICDTKEYQAIVDTRDEELEKLRDIATDFLNNEGITNEEVRDAYISKFVNDHETMWSKLCEYTDRMKYTMLPDMFITFCKITNDKTRLLNVMKQIGNRETIKEVMIDVNELIERLDTDDYYNELCEELEAI